MKVLVTGGSGFIGSHVVDKLRDRGHEPRILDMIESPHHAPDEIETVIGDVSDSRALERAMEGCEAVMHLAAVADVSQVTVDPGYAQAINAGGTLNALDAARAAGVERFVYASTIWVYDGQGGTVAENDRLALPAHVYTATKLAGEMYCTSYAKLFGLDYTILRFGIPYGPRARPAAVVPSFVRKALDGEPLTVSGDGSQSRRFVYVEDLACGVVEALRPVAANEIYNLVTDESVTVLELASVIRDLVGNVDIEHLPARGADFSGAEVCGARAAEQLGWTATTPIVEGVRRYIDWLASRLDTASPPPEAVDSALG